MMFCRIHFISMEAYKKFNMHTKSLRYAFEAVDVVDVVDDNLVFFADNLPLLSFISEAVVPFSVW